MAQATGRGQTMMTWNEAGIAFGLLLLMEGLLLTFEKRHPTLIRETLEAFELHTDATTAAPQVLSLVRA